MIRFCNVLVPAGLLINPRHPQTAKLSVALHHVSRSLDPWILDTTVPVVRLVMVDESKNLLRSRQFPFWIVRLDYYRASLLANSSG